MMHEKRSAPHDWDNLSAEEFEQAKLHYSNRLADAFESVACVRLLEQDPSIEHLLYETSLMSQVPEFPIPGSAIVFPRKDQDGRMLYGYTWEMIDSMSSEELGLALFERISADIACGKIG
jgi:hypothetical protein